MYYWEYFIKKEAEHYKVESPDGLVWRTDTIEEAKHDIDQLMSGEQLHLIKERSDESGN